MKSHDDHTSPLFNFPVLLILTTIMCLASYSAFGLNTAIGVATGSTVLAFFTLGKGSDSRNGD
jgi:hypothetical protein